MSDYVIETEALSLYYGRRLALDRLTLHLPRGGNHTFIGANGAGRSSLVRMLLGFERASVGKVRVLGHDCPHLTLALRERVGYVNEEHVLPEWMCVCDLKRIQ